MPMEYRYLGKTGLRVSALSFGSWVTFKNQVDVDAAYKLMKQAYDAGVNFFDNAEIYANGESERVMGEALKKGFEAGTWKRSDLVICTKIFFGSKKPEDKGPNDTGLSKKHLREGCRASLDRLQLDYVDVLLCHRPDSVTPIEETCRAMNWLIQQGWILYWGTSEWTAEQIRDACRVCQVLGLEAPIADQAQYNVFHRQRVDEDYRSLYRDYGYGLTTWSPLASGVLTGKYSGGKIPEGSRLSLSDMSWLKEKFMNGDNRIEIADKLKPIADEIGCTLGQLAIAFCVRNKHVSTVILGATSEEQLAENLKALEYAVDLDDEVMKKISEIAGKAKIDESVETGLNVRKVGYREHW